MTDGFTIHLNGGPHGPEGVLVAVAHGSAVPRAAATVADLMTVVAERAARRGVDLPDLCIAYLGHAPPSLPQVLSTLEPGTRVTVLPLLLTAAYHSKTDIPRVFGDFPRLRIRYGAALGPHPLLIRALERRLAEADPGVLENRGRTGVVLAASGSLDPAAASTTPVCAGSSSTPGSASASRCSSARVSSGCGPSGAP